MAHDFSNLPSELQSAIFRLLDPIALISFSQTSKIFRQAISPSQQHLVERLLAIECLEQHGGPALHFRSRDNALSPAWDDDKINDMRWACTSCMRLLPHTHFDNHSLLRLGARKPPSKIPAALPCTSWEPNGLVASKAVLRRRRTARRTEFQRLKRQYSVAVSLNWGKDRSTQSACDRLDDFQNAGIEVFMDMSIGEFELLNELQETQILDEVAQSIERHICGYQRYRRRCNECRFQLGDLRWHVVVPRPGIGLSVHRSGANIGTAHVPAVRSRRLYFGTFVHRYFPRFFTSLPSHRREADKAPVFPIYRDNACDRMFTLYMIRCGHCASWKEMADFRCGNHWPKWWPSSHHPWGEQIWQNWDGTTITDDFIEKLRCHTCYRREHGRDAFAKDILTWYIKLLITETSVLHRHLSLGWSLVWRTVESDPIGYVRPGDWFAPKQFRFDIRTEVLAGLPWKDHHEKDKGVTYFGADATMLHKLKQKHKILKTKLGTWHVQTDMDPHHPTYGWNDWFASWMTGYDNLEAQWIWFRDCKKQILKEPERLVEWALGDDGPISFDTTAIWEQITDELSTKWSSPDIKQI